MAVVTWQDLCIDAIDVPAQATFWAAATGLTVGDPEAPARLDGPTDRHRIWVNQVDRPHRVKNRTHLDVGCASVEELVALGARVLAPAEETGFGWTVMADPEDNEFCAFVHPPERLPAYRVLAVGIDCRDGEALARWWGELLGAERRPVPGEECWALVGVAADEQMALDFANVPEPRVEPNRLHWDVVGDVGELLSRGATHLWDQPRWTVLADPEGNEFCVFPPG